MKVAVVGNLAGVARDIVIGLRRAGVAADLFLERHELAVMREDTSGQASLEGAAVHVLDRDLGLAGAPGLAAMAALHLPVAARLTRYDIIHSHTGSLAGSPLTRLLFVRLGLRPYLAFATGSDFREVARLDRGRRGERMREFFRNAADVLLLNMDMLGFKDACGFPEARFFPFVIDTERFAPPAPRDESAAPPGPLECFMMSNLDFGIRDNSPGRNSMNNNDRVLRAVARFVAKDPNIRLTLLDRGPDREEARRLVSELGIGAHVVFKPAMSQLERIRHLEDADVVLDQFHLPAFGLGGLEALSIGKPLLTYIDDKLCDLAYGCGPDFLLPSHTEDEILENLLRLRDPKLRRALSVKARRFVLDHHARDVVIARLIALYRRHAARRNG